VVPSATQKANPYPTRSEAPSNPYPNAVAPSKADAMLRGFTRDGVVHILGGTTLPDGIFVKIIRE
jgi:probable phosphoglycerate mutase